MFNFDSEKIFENPPASNPKPSLFGGSRPKTIPEKVDETARRLRDTLERLQMFEANLTEKCENLMSVLTQDNVTFKELMRDGWKEFVSTVQAEVNLFETQIEAALALFEKGTNDQIAENLERIEAAEMYMKQNLNASVEALLHSMESAGELVGVIDSEVFVSVKRYGAKGDGVTDDTAAIRAAVESLANGGTVYVPNGVYIVSDDIEIPSNITVKGDTSSTIQKAATDSSDYSIFKANGSENVTFENLEIIGDRYTHTGTAGEWGMGISLTGTANATVKYCRIIGCWGDGVYIGSNGSQGCENVMIEGCNIDDNRRNGVSVINVDGLHVSSSVIRNTNGTAPEFGICFECNNTGETVKNAIISGCRFANNKYGVGFSGSSNVYEVTVDNCTFAEGNGVYICRTMTEGIGGFINVRNSVFAGNNGFIFDAKTVDGIPVTIDNNQFYCDAVPIRIGYAELNLAETLGGIVINNCTFAQWGDDHYPVMIRTGTNTNATYDQIYISGKILPKSHAMIFASSPVTGTLSLSREMIDAKSIVSDTALNGSGNIYTRANVNLASTGRMITLAESFPYGVEVELRLTGSNANALTLVCENGIFGQVSDSANSATFKGLYKVVTVRHEAANRWSYRVQNNS